MPAVHNVGRHNPVSQPMAFTVIGLDLGKLSDYSALAGITWTVPGGRSPRWKPDYNVPTLHRWALGTSYKDVGASVLKFHQGIAEKVAPGLITIPPVLVADSTGVGEAVLESLYEQFIAAKAKGFMTGVTITAGNAVKLAGNARWHVSKMQLVSILQVLLGTRRLHVAPALEHGRVLLRELETFQVKVTEALNVTYETLRARDHDDLVLAVALACWGAETLGVCKPPALPTEPQPHWGGMVRTPRW
jgi:hypothetical protein